MNEYQKREQLLIEKVIDLLKTQPNSFSAIGNGQIVLPLEPKMTKKQKRVIRKLLVSIAKKDSEYLIQRLLKDTNQNETINTEPCPNCKETKQPCACMRNLCCKCGKPVGNITFTVCDDCWNENG